jgi:hypothetical protein
MIIFALCLQFFCSQHTLGLSEPTSIMKDRLVDTAVRLVTSNEMIVACIEGLECIILEGAFHANTGNLRRAWIAFRKATVVAQLMKLDLPNPPPVEAHEANTRLKSKLMWFRICYMDSFLSLMLGLPHGGQDTNMEKEIADETPSGKLQRTHTHIARRIIERNRRETSSYNLTITRQLDRELLDVANALPEAFWVVPDFANLQPNSREAFLELLRLCDHLHHYNLVHLLHLPYLLRSEEDSSYHTYSKITCVNASREIITRFISWSNLNRDMIAVYCRIGDFFALMAGITILLAHIDSHKLQVEDWRTHRRIADRALVQHLLEIYERFGMYTNDNLTKKSAEQLRTLLDIERGAAQGIVSSAHGTVSCLEYHCGDLRLSIPYFGIINIGREGVTMDKPIGLDGSQHVRTDIPECVHAANHFLSTVGFGDAMHQNPQATPYLPAPDVQTVPSGAKATDDVDHRQLQYPSMAASLDDWAFQGVDAAFFDSLIRGATDWEPTLEGTGT